MCPSEVAGVFSDGDPGIYEGTHTPEPTRHVVAGQGIYTPEGLREGDVVDEEGRLLQRDGIELPAAEELEDWSPAWAEATRADPEIGCESFDANLAVARKVLAEYGTPGLNALLRDSRLGDHPELVRLVVRLGKALKGRK